MVAANVKRIIESRNLIHNQASGSGFVRLIHGANEDVLPLGGQQVGRVRHELSGLFNIDPAASPLINGFPVSNEHLLQHADTLEFIVPLGRKGVGRVWTQEEYSPVPHDGGRLRGDDRQGAAGTSPGGRLGQDHRNRFRRLVQTRGALALHGPGPRRQAECLRACPLAYASSGKLPEPIELGPKLSLGTVEILDWIALGCPNQKYMGRHQGEAVQAAMNVISNAWRFAEIWVWNQEDTDHRLRL